MNALIRPDDYASLWALIALGTAAGLWLEQQYRWAARLSGPVMLLAIAMALSNFNVMPGASPAYDFVTDWLTPLAIPLLLCRANIRELVRTGGRVVAIFHISSVGTLVGTALACGLLRRAIHSPDLEHAAGMMAASYIGGGVNFMAIKASYRVAENVANPLIVADNFVMAAVFVGLLAAAGSQWFRARFPHPHSHPTPSRKASPSVPHPHGSAGLSLPDSAAVRPPIRVVDLANALAFAFTALALARLAGRGAAAWFSGVNHPSAVMEILKVLCTNSYVLITAATLLMATVFAGPMSRVRGTEELGGYLLSLFLFTLGLPADLMAVLTQAPIFFAFCGIIAAVNVSLTLTVGWLLRLNLEEVLLVVNANLGGAPSAAAMAISAGWPRLVLPGILAGIWGYAIGTPIGIMVVETIKRF